MVFIFDNIDLVQVEELEKFHPIIDPYRLEKANRYSYDKDKKLCIIGYLLLLFALYTDNVCHKNIKFDYNEYGKPEIKTLPDKHFNISHSDKVAVCSLGSTSLGIDVQDWIHDYEDIIETVCSEKEKSYINQSTDKKKSFTKIWTMKESYLKCIGTGLIDELNRFCTFEDVSSQSEFKGYTFQTIMNSTHCITQYSVAKELSIKMLNIHDFDVLL